MYNSSRADTQPANATVPQTTNCTLSSAVANATDTFGSPEFKCFCDQFIQFFNSTRADLNFSWSAYDPDIALKGCTLIMRGLLSSTYTQRPVSFVESPIAAQRASAVAARSNVLTAGVPFSTLLATNTPLSDQSFFLIEALTRLMSLVYQVMIDGSYLPSTNEFWALENQIISSGFPNNLQVDQVLAFPIILDNQTSNIDAVYSAAMPVVQFSWPDYLTACNPLYCDVVKHNSAGYRAFIAFSAFGGIWTAVFIIVKSLIWPFFEWVIFKEKPDFV